MPLDIEFETFWQAFPRRTEKIAARKAYLKARKMASAQEILDGVARYKANKPGYADWCHPATFLNRGRWMDEADAPVGQAKYEWHCTHDPHCRHRAECDVVSMRKTG